MSLSFDEDLGKPEKSDTDKKAKYKKFKKRKGDEPNQPENLRKKTKKEMMLKTREEVNLLSITWCLYYDIINDWRLSGTRRLQICFI